MYIESKSIVSVHIYSSKNIVQKNNFVILFGFHEKSYSVPYLAKMIPPMYKDSFFDKKPQKCDIKSASNLLS